VKIVIKSKNLKLTPALETFVREKINSLEKFAENFLGKKYFNHFFGKGKPRVESWVEIEKTAQSQTKPSFFRAECQMRFPGQTIRAEAKAEDLRQAVVEVKDILQRELKEYKNKAMAETKRGARKAKKNLKISPQARFDKKGRVREEGI
jgi:ribosomal subunit interface protein